MKQISFSKAAARILYLQLEGKGDGYTIKQIRLLDKIISIFDLGLSEYNQKIESRIEKAKEELKENFDKLEHINSSLNNDLDAITAGEGRQEVTFSFEDEQFQFIMQIWIDLSGIKGNKVARDLIIEIDDALKNVPESKN